MASRAISIPRPGRPRTSWRLEHLVLPVGGIGFALMLVVLLSISLAGLPDAVRPLAPAVGAAPVVADPVDALDPIEPITAALRPRSPEPAAGLAFVRCTNLWTSRIDGSDAHRILSLPGLSSPAFAPDGRTIAAFAATAEGIDLVLVAADGSAVRVAGTLRQDGSPVVAVPAGLTWSPGGRELSFALSPPEGAGPWTVWTLDLTSGALWNRGVGGPAPFYLGGSLVVARTGPAADFRVLAGRNRWNAKRLSGPLADRAAATSPGWWKEWWMSDTATLAVRPDGQTVVTLRERAYARRGRTFEAPPGTSIDPSRRPAVVQDGPVVITLTGADGERDLGLLDPVTGEWRILEYAWEPAVSPAPPATGPIDVVRAVSLVEHLLWRWHRAPADTALLLDGPRAPAVTAFRNLGFTFGEPRRADGSWRIPATLFGRTSDGFGSMRLAFAVHPDAGRLAVRTVATGPFRPVRTIDDAVALLRSIVTVPMLPLPTLPAGTTLGRWPIYASSWRGVTTGQLNLSVPTPAGQRPVMFHFGEGGFGCVEPVPETLSTGTEAIATDPEFDTTYQQVAWPVSGPTATSGPFGISGELPRETLLAMAAEMDRARLAAAGP